KCRRDRRGAGRRAAYRRSRRRRAARTVRYIRSSTDPRRRSRHRRDPRPGGRPHVGSWTGRHIPCHVRGGTVTRTNKTADRASDRRDGADRRLPEAELTDTSDPVQPDVVIVTGLSGAGRSTAAKCLEDLGWFVVDNLPPSLLSTMVELGARSLG